MKKIEYQDEHEVRFAFLHEEHDQHMNQSLEAGESIIVGEKKVTFGKPTLLSDLPETPTGLCLGVDLDRVIDEIYVEAIPINQFSSKGKAEALNKVKTEAMERYDLIRNLLKSNGLGCDNIFLSEVF